MEYALHPDLGKFHLLGKKDFDAIGLEELQMKAYSEDVITMDQLSEGMVIVFKTKDGRYGKFRVDVGGMEPAIYWITYQ
ncbi:hypothetical protein [Daejeonella oryzae]|uniref:hypothetical protein n=1 Tax=Daejeonella oryzae TaxID=1122943 RepID=UPI000403C59D|nr:hypothetical protein [Daejeonella oryzae]